MAIVVRVMLILAGLLLIYRAAFKAYDFGYRVFSEPPITTGAGADVEVVIPMGAGPSAIGDILENAGLIEDSTLFLFQERLSPYHGLLQPGTYTLNTSMTAEEMMAVMAAAEKEEEESE